ncbi:3974_t:CDS:2, partial [Entrophospora sp. SA101]
TRKRMSTIVRGPDGKIKLYCKGADTVILERLESHWATKEFLEKKILVMKGRVNPESEFTFHNSFSGQVIYESWTITYYNVLFTVLPPMVIGVFDQFVSARMLDRYPQMYMLGQKSEFFNVKSFWGWTINAFFHSLILYWTSIYIFSDDLTLADGRIAGHWTWGTTLYTAVLATVLGKAALIT